MLEPVRPMQHARSVFFCSPCHLGDSGAAELSSEACILQSCMCRQAVMLNVSADPFPQARPGIIYNSFRKNGRC